MMRIYILPPRAICLPEGEAAFTPPRQLYASAYAHAKKHYYDRRRRLARSARASRRS